MPSIVEVYSNGIATLPQPMPSAFDPLSDFEFALRYDETATQEQPYLIPSGQHLVAGHYVLRFDA